MLRLRLRRPIPHNLTAILLISTLVACGVEDNTTAPAVVDKFPVEDGKPVTRDTDVYISFNEAMSRESITDSSFSLTDSDDNPVASLLTFDGSSATIRLKPNLRLKPNARYTVTASSAINDLSGQSLTEVRWQFVTDDGLWAAPDQIINTTIEGGKQNPQMAFDTQGNALLVWQQLDGSIWDIWASRYSKETGWGSAEKIETLNTSAREPKIAIDSNGNAIAIWRQRSGSVNSIWANNYINGKWGSIATEIDSDDGDVRSHQLAIGSDGTAFAIWTQELTLVGNYSVMVNRYNNGWTGADKISSIDTERSDTPQIALGTQGNAVAVWSSVNGATSRIFASRYTGDGTWLTAQSIQGNVVGSASSPHIVIDEADNAIVVWIIKVGLNPSSIYYNRYFSLADWGANAELVEFDDFGSSDRPQIAISANGKNIVAVWRQYDGSYRNIMASSFVNSTWSESVEIESDGNNVFDPQVVIDSNGNASAIWYETDDAGTRRIMANRLDPKQGWFVDAEVILDNAGIGIPNPKISIDSNGNHFSYWEQIEAGSVIEIWVSRFE